MTACATDNPPPPIIQVQRVYPDISPNLLACTAEPKPGQIITDTQLADWAESVRVAGGNCRSRLDTIKKMVDGWPH